VARQPCKARRQLRIGVGHRRRKPFGGEPVGLRKQDVHSDCRRTGCAKLIDELRNQGARHGH